MSDRARGTVLYAGAAVLLGAGVFWWVAAAPSEPRDARIEQYQATALRLLPDVASQVDAGSVALAAGAERQVLAEVGNGEMLVSVVCVGGESSRVRISLGDIGDSGHGMECSGDVVPETFEVTAVGELRLNVSVNESGPVVFRYSMLRLAD
jgi:hypothetical protein